VHSVFLFFEIFENKQNASLIGILGNLG